MTSRRRLIVMRHAKAEPFAATDEERALTERGRRDAAEAGQHLARIGAVPDHAVVSSATRAVETWQAVARGSASTAEVSVDAAVYSGRPALLLEAVQTVPPTAETVIVVGHNPSVAHLAHLLDDGAGDPAALEEMLRGYPTSALAVFEIEVPWSELAPECGRVLEFHVGHG